MKAEEFLKQKNINNGSNHNWDRPDKDPLTSELMEEYAKQEAICFQNWIDKNEYYKMTTSDKFWYTDDNFDERGTFITANSIEELYSIYKQGE